MSTRIRRRLPALVALTAVALACPVAASASSPRGSGRGSGGAGLGGSGASGGAGGSGGSAPTSTAPVVKLSATIEASGNGISVTASAQGLVGGKLRFVGTAPPSAAGGTVVISYSGAATHNLWQQAATATVDGAGQFATSWTATASGQLLFTATLLGAGGTAATADGGSSGDGGSGFGGQTTSTISETPPGETAGAGTQPFTITVFKSARATIYGPGLWGHRTACGERLRRATLGVANRTLKCGTKVSLYYRGREIVVPVIDRGPFANHASWDLTAATARALGITQTATIGTLARRAAQ